MTLKVEYLEKFEVIFKMALGSEQMTSPDLMLEKERGKTFCETKGTVARNIFWSKVILPNLPNWALICDLKQF
jgi:hypothetical protein